MGEQVTFASNGSTAHGYLAVPSSGRGPGLIVIQEWWGLVDHIIDLTDRFAAAGFVALAPDLYGGKTTHDAETAGKYLQELPVQQAARDLGGAVDFLLGRPECSTGSVGAVGFCMGGGFVLLLAKNQGVKVSAAVSCYPANTGMLGDLTGIAAPIELHLAGEDAFFPLEAGEQLAATLRDSASDVTVHVYPGRGHAFVNEENLLDTFDKDAADLLWQRSVDFLKAHVS